MVNAIFARKHDSKESFLVVTGDWPKIEQQYEAIIGNGQFGTDFREAHAEIVVIKDGARFAAHNFESRKTQLVMEARRILQEHKASEVTLAVAQKRFDDAKAALENLSPLHQELLTTEK